MHRLPQAPPVERSSPALAQPHVLSVLRKHPLQHQVPWNVLPILLAALVVSISPLCCNYVCLVMIYFHLLLWLCDLSLSGKVRLSTLKNKHRMNECGFLWFISLQLGMQVQTGLTDCWLRLLSCLHKQKIPGCVCTALVQGHRSFMGHFVFADNSALRPHLCSHKIVTL